MYRAFLRGRILANRSSGKWRELLKILTTIGVASGTISAEPDYPAAWVVRLDEPPDGFTGADAFELLEDAKLGGVRLLLEYPIQANAATFKYAPETTPASPPNTSTATGYGSLTLTTGGAYGSVRASDPAR